MNLTREQVRRYFESRLNRSLPSRDKVAARCPFHDDRSPSMTLFLTGAGGFCCHGCGAKGSIFHFEMRLSQCDMKTAWRNIAAQTGAEMPPPGSPGHLVGVYDYRRADGTVLFQKRRYEAVGGKSPYSICRWERGRWILGQGEVEPVLYNLHLLVVSSMLFIAEGEKDCDTLTGLNLWPDRPDLRIAATTNFDGGTGKWRTEYSPLFAQKVVIIFEDNDDVGRAWAERVAAAVHPYAGSVRRIAFLELPEKGDVSDWMQDHTSAELAARIQKAPEWHPPQFAKRVVFVDFAEFVTSSAGRIDWMLGGIIERGSNGFIAAPPKGAKSFCSADLVIALATGSPWLDFSVVSPVRVGLVSREDNPALTAWRLKHLMEGREFNPVQLQYLESGLYVNTRAQTPGLMLDDQAQTDELIAAIKERRLEFVILDVFNVLHAADENDNTEMRVVLNHCKRIQDETGAAMGIVHHYNKELQGSITQRLRGASAISGFAEWMIGITMADEEARIRRMEFELKAASPPSPIYFCILAEEDGPARIRRVAYGNPPRPASSPLRSKGAN